MEEPMIIVITINFMRNENKHLNTLHCYGFSFVLWFRSRVANLGYMYLWEYICLSAGVHLWLAIEDKNIFIYYLFPNIHTYISKYYFQTSLHAYC